MKQPRDHPSRLIWASRVLDAISALYKREHKITYSDIANLNSIILGNNSRILNYNET